MCNSTVRDFLAAPIADKGSLIQSGALFFLENIAGLIAGRAGATFDTAYENLVADIDLAA